MCIRDRYTNESGEESRELIHNFTGAGIIQGMHNTRASIESFARSCFNFALDTCQDLWFATKDTISKKYDHTFKAVSYTHLGQRRMPGVPYDRDSRR